MIRLKSIGIALVMLLSLCLVIVNKSEAASASLSVSTSDDYGGGGYTYAYVTADENIDFIDWYIDDVYSFTSLHGNTKNVSEYLGDFDGDIKGRKYNVRAVVSFEESSDDDATDTFRVFAPKMISGTKYPQGIPDHEHGTGVYGYVQLSGHYHDGQNIVMSGSVYAWNGTKAALQAESWYRHTEFKDLDGDGLDETVWTREDPRPLKPLPASDSYYTSGSSMITYPLGRDIKKDEKIKLNAHVHLAVSGLVWHEEHNAWTHTFKEEDNQ